MRIGALRREPKACINSSPFLLSRFDPLNSRQRQNHYVARLLVDAGLSQNPRLGRSSENRYLQASQYAARSFVIVWHCGHSFAIRARISHVTEWRNGRFLEIASMRLQTRYERWLQLHRLKAWMAAQPGWKVERMALGLALVIDGCFFLEDGSLKRL